MLSQDEWGKCMTRKKIFQFLDWYGLQSTKKNHTAHLFVAPYEILRLVDSEAHQVEMGDENTIG
jgi:hypothetical protein